MKKYVFQGSFGEIYLKKNIIIKSQSLKTLSNEIYNEISILELCKNHIFVVDLIKSIFIKKQIIYFY